MKDALTKLTFGFVMAQLFPGAIATTAATLAYLAWDRRLPASVVTAVDQLLENWSHGTSAHHLFLLGLCIGFGMFIHGLHWAALGALEKDGKVSVFSSRWHRWPIVFQVLLGPLRMFFELICLGSTVSTKAASIHENVPQIGQDQMMQHEFLQEFYLYSAQFFAHTAWALMSALMALGVFIGKYGCNDRRVTLLSMLYVATGSFFTLARIQLCSLFRGEAELKSATLWTIRGTPGD